MIVCKQCDGTNGGHYRTCPHYRGSDKQPTAQNTFAKYSPMDGKPWAGPPLDGAELRKLFWIHIWRYNPWTGQERTTEDMAADPRGVLIHPRGANIWPEFDLVKTVKHPPTFDEWHLAKYHSTFEADYVSTVSSIRATMLQLTELMREYVSEMVRIAIQGDKP